MKSFLTSSLLISKTSLSLSDPSLVVEAAKFLSSASVSSLSMVAHLCLIGPLDLRGCVWHWEDEGFPNLSSFSAAMAAASRVPAVARTGCERWADKNTVLVVPKVICINMAPSCIQGHWMGWASSGSLYHSISVASSSRPSGPRAGWSAMLRWSWECYCFDQGAFIVSRAPTLKVYSCSSRLVVWGHVSIQTWWSWHLCLRANARSTNVTSHQLWCVLLPCSCDSRTKRKIAKAQKE